MWITRLGRRPTTEDLARHMRTVRFSPPQTSRSWSAAICPSSEIRSLCRLREVDHPCSPCSRARSTWSIRRPHRRLRRAEGHPARARSDLRRARTPIPPLLLRRATHERCPRLSDEMTVAELRVSLSSGWQAGAGELVRPAGQVLVPFGLGEVSTCYSARNGQPVRRVHVPE
jgi:hypothetical protein